MIASMGPAQIGRWYLRWDKNEIFQVTGRDRATHRIQIRTYDGDCAEIDEEAWASLQLGLADPPSDWSGPVETVDDIDLRGPQSGVSPGEGSMAARQPDAERAISEYVSVPDSDLDSGPDSGLHPK